MWVRVDYRLVDEAHFFTSPDPRFAGLCAAHRDLTTAWNEVAAQLDYLSATNHQKPGADFKPQTSLSAMQESLAKGAPPSMLRWVSDLDL